MERCTLELKRKRADSAGGWSARR